MPKGSCLGIIGPNGVGKTTLIKIIAGLIEPSEGEIIFLSRHAKDYTKEIKKKIGFAGSEERSFFWRLSVYDNLDFFGSLYDMPKEARNPLIESMLSLFNLQEVRNKLFVYLSSGMRQKLSLIRSIMHNPELLLLDEPLKNLDVQSKNIFLNWIAKHMKEGKLSSIFISHELEDLLKVADRIALMEKNSFAIFDADQITKVFARFQQVKLKVKEYPENEMKGIASCLVNKFADYYEIVVDEPYANNKLKQLVDTLWAHKIELMNLEILPPKVDMIIEKLKKMHTLQIEKLESDEKRRQANSKKEKQEDRRTE